MTVKMLLGMVKMTMTTAAMRGFTFCTRWRLISPAGPDASMA
jgi:hypothetical protein